MYTLNILSDYSLKTKPAVILMPTSIQEIRFMYIYMSTADNFMCSGTSTKGLSALEQDRIWITWSWIRSGFDLDSILSALVKLLGANRAFTRCSASAF